ncbi:MAG: M42 family metallopeptidase [Anaerolineae bacterium]
MEEIVRELTEAYGPSGAEGKVRKLIGERIAPYVDDQRVDALGNLIAFKRAGTSPAVGRLMLAAHMDEIGLIVSYIDEKGFLRFHPVGGVFPLTLLGSRVIFEDGTMGVIGIEERWREDKIPPLDKLFIDVGATSPADCPVRVGDMAGFHRPFFARGTRWVGKAMDDRIGCAVLVEFLRQVRDSVYDLYVVFTVQEEIGLRGAAVSAYGVEPDVAIAVDITTTGDVPEGERMAVELGKGVAIKVKDSGMIAHPGLRRHMVQTAEKAGVPYQLEVLRRGTTDAYAMQVSREGVPAGVLSIPTRYAHTPSEMVDQRDVRATVDLLLRLVAGPMHLEG